MVGTVNRAVKRGQIWYADLGDGVGTEQRSVRPILVVSNYIGNTRGNIITVVSITSKCKNNLPVHVTIEEECLKSTSTALIEQVRAIDKERLREYMGEVSDKIISEVESALKIQLALNDQFNYKRAYEMMFQVVNANKMIKLFGEHESFIMNRNFHIRNIKEYCNHFNIDVNSIKQQYLAKAQ